MLALLSFCGRLIYFNYWPFMILMSPWDVSAHLCVAAVGQHITSFPERIESLVVSVS